MQTPPAPTAQGSLTRTPFPHLLVYALERRLTGTFELLVGGSSAATLVVVGGAPAKVRTTDGVHYLGDVLVEMGLVDQAAHAASLAQMQETPRLQGQILKELGALDDARLDAGLRAQLERKLEHLFTLPVETEFAFYEGVDALARYGGLPTPVDPLPVLWRGIRQRPQWEHVDATLKRVGGAAVRIGAAAQVDRFQFTRAEASAVELLRQRTMRVVELAGTKVVGPSVAQLLVYCLVITKQVEVVETASMRPPARPVPPAPVPAAAGSQTSQAFARVQLQARPIQRQPLVVEEVAPVPSLADGRIASPMPQPIPLTGEARPGSGSDIGALISHTIASSSPPPPAPEEMLAPQHAFAAPPPGAAFAPPVDAPSATAIAPPPPPSSQPLPAPAASAPAIPAASPSTRELTVEQNSLKGKILERAENITGQNYFQMLGVDESATPEMIQKQFIQLAKVWHPDRLPSALADVKDACSKVFSNLTEAHATLTDPERRAEYMTLLKDGGATPDEQAQVQAVLEAATEFQKAEFHMKRNDNAKAYELAKRAFMLDPEQADYLALMAWIEAQRSENLGKEKTLEKVSMLDAALKRNPNCERAYFYRALLFKRVEESKKAYADFKKAMELNPRNLDAAREVRLYKMRGGASVPPPGAVGAPAPQAPKASKQPAPAEGLGGLFGKLFKK